MERFRNFSLNQRLAAQQAGSVLLPIFTVAANVSGVMLENSQDALRVPTSGFADERDQLARAGLNLLNKPTRLSSPDLAEQEEIRYRLKAIYEAAYGVAVPTLPEPRRDILGIRGEIRRWITLWDMHRYYPDYRAEVAEEELIFDATEIADDAIPLDEEE